MYKKIVLIILTSILLQGCRNAKLSVREATMKMYLRHNTKLCYLEPF